MEILFNKIALLFFSFLTKMKGYSFTLVQSNKQHADADKIFNEGGYKLPDVYQKEMDVYKRNTIKFIAYHNNVPVGTVSLGNPKIINRSFELHGIDEKGEHFELQSLVVKKEHRECSQLVLLGLFKEIYTYSLKNSIKSWLSFGMRHMYLTLRRYNKNIYVIKVNENNCKRPLATYLYDNNIFDTCSIMMVADFDPGRIFLKLLKKQLKKLRN